jgi:hypothetical protein
MRLWHWIASAFGRHTIPEPPPVPLTPPAEHAEASRRARQLLADADRLERQARRLRAIDVAGDVARRERRPKAE